MSALKDKIKDLDSQIASGTKDAKEKWDAFDQLRTELAKSDEDLTDENSEAFKKAHESHREYGEAADSVEALKEAREKLWAMESESNGNGGPPQHREARERIKDGMHSESYGDRIAASEEYKALKASGALTSTGRLGNIRLGEMMSREEAVREIQQRHGSVIVTDPDGDDTVRPFVEPTHRGLVEPRFRPLLLLDLITVGTTDSDSIDYVVETGYVNNAATVPEASTDAPVGSGSPAVDAEAAGVKPQSRLSYEKRDAAVKTIAHWVAATKKSLADVARLRSTIDNRLRRGLGDVLEDQIVDGDGLDENLLGLLNNPGIQHQSRTTGEPLVNDVLRAMTKCRLAFFEPTATGLNSLDFETARLAREDDSNGTGAYIYGPPSQVGPTTMWGVPTVQGPQFPQGQPVTGDFRVVELYIREGVMVIASDSHEDFFTRNLVAILAEMRAGLAIPQPEGLCEVSEGS